MRKLTLDVVTYTDPDSVIAEQYRMVRTNIELSRESEKLQTLFLTSANSGEGKTTTVLNLAVIFARAGKEVLLVDCDLRKHSLSNNFHLENAEGFTGLVNDQGPVSGNIYQTNVPGLSFLPSGQAIKNPAELLLNRQISLIVQQMKETFDLILFDTPPVEEVADALILSPKLDGCILVVRGNFSKKDAVKRTKDALEGMDTNFIGVIHNAVGLSKKTNYSYGYGYGKTPKKKSILRFFK